MYITIQLKSLKRIVVILLGLLLIFLLLFKVFPSSGQRVLAVISSNRKVPIYAVDKEEKEVALTFDATWGASYTDSLLEILDEHQIKATFFLSGRWIEEFPEEAKLIAEKGHEIGNHSLTHPHMTQISREKKEAELLETHRLIKETTGQECRLFRCPFGEYNNQVIEVCEAANYLVIQWDVDSLDWREYADARYIYERVTGNVKPGSIVLFHNNGAHTAQALPQIIGFLQSDGFTFVPVSELIYQEDYYIDPFSGLQKKNRS